MSAATVVCEGSALNTLGDHRTVHYVVYLGAGALELSLRAIVGAPLASRGLASPVSSRALDAQGYTPAFYPRKSDLLKTWVGGGLNKSRRPGAAGLFRPSGRLLGARVTFSEPCSRFS